MSDTALARIEGFYRDGSPAGLIDAARFDKRGKAENIVPTRICGRCGGAGRSDRWAATGYTCFDCGGAGKVEKPFNKPIYTAERLAKLNAAGEKASAKRAAKFAAEEAARAEAREKFFAENAAWFEKAKLYVDRSEFIRDVLATVERRGEISDKQRAAVDGAVDKIVARDADRAHKIATSNHVGFSGERIKFTAVVERVFFIKHDERYYPPKDVYAITLRDESGNALSYFGDPRWLRWENGEPARGYTVSLSATVKEHRVYKEEKQTVIGRPTEVKSKQEEML